MPNMVSNKSLILSIIANSGRWFKEINNVYFYADQNPLKYTDPRGLFSITGCISSTWKWAKFSWAVQSATCAALAGLEYYSCQADCDCKKNDECDKPDKYCKTRCILSAGHIYGKCKELFREDKSNGEGPPYGSGGAGAGSSW
jgi:hypothetical protein